MCKIPSLILSAKCCQVWLPVFLPVLFFFHVDLSAMYALVGVNALSVAVGRMGGVWTAVGRSGGRRNKSAQVVYLFEKFWKIRVVWVVSVVILNNA